ncbi:MAG: hypothetical protein H7287_04030 [Thermoleophilia bacterium]|nr:hypothetical protein [Thermoleophilia bacterium]
MQLQPTTSLVRSAPRVITDALPVPQIFRLAGEYFDRALSAIDLQAPPPSQERVASALLGARRGAALLQSAVVPSTPFIQREQARAAANHARIAAEALTRYGVASAEFGELGPLLDLISDAYRELNAARTILR